MTPKCPNVLAHVIWRHCFCIPVCVEFLMFAIIQFRFARNSEVFLYKLTMHGSHAIRFAGLWRLFACLWSREFATMDLSVKENYYRE